MTNEFKYLEELTDHLVNLIESNDERFTFEFGTIDELGIYDKQNNKLFMIYINEIKE